MNFTNKIVCIILLISFTGCKKDLLVTIPNDRISAEIYWKTENDAILGTNAIYPYLENAWNYVHWDAMSDIGHVTLTWRDESGIEKNAFDATLPRISTEWSTCYKAIQAANSFLQNVAAIPTTPVIERLKAEVRFLRAYQYIKLVSLFGGVPLVTEVLSLDESRKLTKTSAPDVWNFISKELDESSALLPVTQQDKGRITKGAALALNARALLYAGKYADAAIAAKKVMDMNVYSLHPSYAKLFTYEAEGNAEVILDRQYLKDVQNNNIFQLTTPNSIFPQVNSFVPTKQAVDAYQMANGKPITDVASGFDPYNPYTNRDPRLKFTVFTPGDVLPNNAVYNSKPGSGTADAIGHSENATSTGFNVKKYLNKEDMAQPANGGINLILIRYADVLLMYAEAKIESNQLDQSVLNAINLVRQRADVNMPPKTTLGTQEEMRAILRNERLVELAFEGLRYFDIKRWKIAEKVVPGIVYGMTYVDAGGALKTVAQNGFQKVFNKDRDYLWPIPQREVQLNPALIQNPLW